MAENRNPALTALYPSHVASVLIYLPFSFRTFVFSLCIPSIYLSIHFHSFSLVSFLFDFSSTWILFLSSFHLSYSFFLFSFFQSFCPRVIRSYFLAILQEKQKDQRNTEKYRTLSSVWMCIDCIRMLIS